MALQITTNINVDFYDNKYIMINAKQYDDKSRLISITCYNQGDIYNISSKNHTAYIKYRKADGRWVLNCCTINYKGQVLVELTEQMLAASGICYVDLFIVNKGSAIVNIDTGSIVTIDGSSVLTTKAFYVDVQEAVVDNSLIESIDEYNGLTDLISMAEAEYGEVIKSAKSYAIGTGNTARENDEKDNSKYYSEMSKSWAIGNTGVRTGENTDNAKYYGEQAHASADAADESEANALSYMNTAKSHKDDAEAAQSAAETAQNKSETAQSKAEAAQSAAETAEQNAETARQKAEDAQGAAETAQSKSETAQNAAETAQQKAEIAQQGAETARSALEAAQNAAETAQQKAEAAQQGAETAEQNAEQAAEQAAQNAVDNVSTLMNDYVTASQESATNAANSEQAAATSEANAKVSETNASTSEANAKNSEQAAANSVTSASASEANALGYADIAKSYAIGGTSIRENEDIDNAKYYYELANSIAENLNSNIATVDEVKEYLGI